MDERVAITGAGIVSSLGHSSSEIWDALLEGRTGIDRIEGFDPIGFDCKVAAQVKGLDPSVLKISRKDSRIMDIHSYMLMKCTRDAFLQAGLDARSVPSEEIGFFAGMGMVDYDIEDLLPSVVKSTGPDGSLAYDAFYSKGYNEIYPLWPLSMLNNISFCQVAISLDIRGENAVFSPHADSGAQAVAEGAQAVINRKSKVALAGGVSEKISPVSLARAHLCGILNTSDGSDDMHCRPFGAVRKGTVLGEGGGVLALELHSSAVKRGVTPMASIAGYGCAFETDGGFSGPTAKAIAQSMRRTLDCAGMTPSDIDVVIAHGDGTPAGDSNEIDAINQVFSNQLGSLHVFSSKGALGLLHAAAPVVDIILGIHMLKTGLIPPMAGSAHRDRGIIFNLPGDIPLRRDIRRILINCSSYEGQAASLIIER